MPALRLKGDLLTSYLEFLLDRLPPGIVHIITPRDLKARGSQLSLRFSKEPKVLLTKLGEAGVFCDFREPDVIRAAPAPLYCGFLDVYRFVRILESHARD
jgi:kynureninase